MHTLLNIDIADVDGHIQVTAQETTDVKVDFLLAKEASIIELLEPCLNVVWDPISRVITPKHVVVKLEEINKACIELYCHFLDLDWPLIQLDIAPLGDISELDALKMAVSYCKHLDRHTSPHFTQSLPVFPQAQYSPSAQRLLECSARNLSRPCRYLSVKNEQVRELGCANQLYLVRRSATEVLHIEGEWDNPLLSQLLLGMRDSGIPLHKLTVSKIPAEHISLVSDVVWQNPRLVELYLHDDYNTVAFLKLDSTVDFFPLETPMCSLAKHDVPDADDDISFPMEELKSRYVYYNRNLGHWDNWVSRCPSLVNATRLDCLVQNIYGMGKYLTQIGTLSLNQLNEFEDESTTVVPPFVHTLNLTCSVSVDDGCWLQDFVFPTYLRNLELSVHLAKSDDTDELPIDVLLKPLTTCLTHLRVLKIVWDTLYPPKEDFPDFKSWPNLAYLTLELATVKMAHQILDSVPTTQWRGLNLMILDTDPNREGMFKGLEEADWRGLKQVGMHHVDFVNHANMLKQFHGLVKLTVKHVPRDSPLWPRLMEALNPNSHPKLQTIERYHVTTGFPEKVEVPADEMAWLLTWPTLVCFPGSDKCFQCRWNRIRQTKLLDLAVHPLKLIGF